MKLIIGLGNPGSRYQHSRHNIGFMVIKEMAKRHNISINEHRWNALIGRGLIENEQAILGLPLTFMNLSGEAVARLLEGFGLTAKDMLVVCDDIDLKMGKLRLRMKGSSGGHRGLESIISSLDTDGFARFRIGIGRPEQSKDASKYVLGGFDKGQKTLLKTILDTACRGCETWVKDGIISAMNKFNRLNMEDADVKVI